MLRLRSAGDDDLAGGEMLEIGRDTDFYGALHEQFAFLHSESTPLRAYWRQDWFRTRLSSHWLLALLVLIALVLVVSGTALATAAGGFLLGILGTLVANRLPEFGQRTRLSLEE